MAQAQGVAVAAVVVQEGVGVVVVQEGVGQRTRPDRPSPLSPRLQRPGPKKCSRFCDAVRAAARRG